MDDTNFNDLLTRAADTTKAWVSENWSRPLGTPDDILDKLIQYDDAFRALWNEYCEQQCWDDEIDIEHPDMQTLLEIIGQTQESCIVPDHSRIGAELREARMAAGYSIRGLAKEAGVSHQNIARLESGAYNVSIDIISKILRPLGKRVTIE